MTLYLLVRESDGAILDGFDSGGSLLKVLQQVGSDEHQQRGLSVVSVADGLGPGTGTTSIAPVRSARHSPMARRRTA
jgi:hypothetical protein